MNNYFDTILTFNGPLLSVLQAAIGTYYGLIITKKAGNRLNISKQKEINQLHLIIWSIVSAIVLVALGAVGLHKGLPPYIYYPVPLLLSFILPKYIFNLSLKELCIYIVSGILIGFLTHLLFSLIVGYNNYLPFWKIDPIW